MKEIWMEKLLELLNEHRIELAHWNLQNQLMRHYNGYVFWLWDLNSQNCVLLIISKEYWFIKWLVENDKIDNKKIADETYVKVNWEWYELILGCHYDLYQQTLMLLSISDTPIEDLISYLK